MKKSKMLVLCAGLVASQMALAQTQSAAPNCLAGCAAPANSSDLWLPTTAAPKAYQWMSPEVVSDAWSRGYRGQGATISVYDFRYNYNGTYTGNLGEGYKSQSHGMWVSQVARLIAPQANVRLRDVNEQTRNVFPLASKGLNVINVSMSMDRDPGPALDVTGAGIIVKNYSSILQYAKDGSAIVVKSAGNNRVGALDMNAQGEVDVMNYQLSRNTKTAIFVGALDRNGLYNSSNSLARMASYSNTAGQDQTMQSKFLVVGVDESKTGGLKGTSIAAPIVAGYAAIIGSKFQNATAETVTQQLLRTARRDTVANYSAAVYGMGEASLSRALAPVGMR